MIRLEKSECPQVLTNNAAVWTAELKAEMANGGDKVTYRRSKYNHPEIKAALIDETSRKCAYCESLVLHVTYGDIEHITPKATDVNLTFDWDNLTLACDVCNTKKGNKEGIIDPYQVEPEDEFGFAGPMILHLPGRASALVTRTELDLNRIDLVGQRIERIDALENLFRGIEAHPEAGERARMLNAIISHETSADKEYAACARAYLKGTGRIA